MQVYIKPKYKVTLTSAEARDLLDEISSVLSSSNISPDSLPALLELDALLRRETGIIVSAHISEWSSSGARSA